MKKINFKLFLTTTFILVGVFSLFFISNTKVSAQVVKDTIKVETTGYSILGESSFVFGGYYSGNIDKKGFTTYFEFKKNDANLDNPTDRKETIKIVRDTNVEEYNDFYTSPELDLFSDYSFRAVGYFNDNPDIKYYGGILQMRTGYIPIGMTYPFTTVGNNNIPITMKFISANILVDNITKNSADFKTTIYNKDFQNFDFKIEYGEKSFDFESDLLQFNSLGKSIITIDSLKPKTTYKYRLYDTADKLTPTTIRSFTTKDNVTTTTTESWYFQGQLTGKTNIDTEGPFSSEQSCISNKNIYVGQNIGKILKDCYKVTSSIVPDPTAPGWYFQGQIIGNTKTDIEGPFTTEQICNDNENIYVGQNIGKILKDCYQITSTPSNSTAPKDFSGGLVPCDGSATNPCEFDQLLKLINDVISFVFTNLILPFAAIMFAYAGFELITSGGETSKREKAKKIFTNVAVGLIIAAAAFLIVKTILLIVGARTDIGINWFGF